MLILKNLLLIFFGGSIRKFEKPIKALLREIREEIDVDIEYKKKFCKIFYKKDRMECNIYSLSINKDILNISEGQDYGFFSYNEIISNNVYSKKTKKNHEMTQITLKAIKKFNRV